ncbi:helix-turn-helix domain-containing protein, partial [Microbacterium sp. 13-71-7]|uniref:TetR/AcrR family transcriptional regulator n=1 Tax=Microbacterium sp. 13-71-7 TaxID=1970399 RepID=UPI0025E3CE8F
MTVPEQILDAAAHLFVTHGFAGTTTRMIADRVGIRQATLYYHFATKDKIFVSLLETTLLASLDAAVALDRQVAEGEIDPAG